MADGTTRRSPQGRKALGRAGALTVLGIETSCDETAAAVVRRNADGTGTVLSDVIRSQLEEHAAFGGVVPEIAARAHVEALDGIVLAALSDTGMDAADVDAIAVTAGPGLVGGLIAGVMTAKAMAYALDKPLVAVNHLEGHALTAGLTEGAAFPYLLLLVSGGHTQILLAKGVGDYERWGTTIDDALGEAFDKTAKLLGLPYPGGPAVELAAKSGNPDRFHLPRPMRGEPGSDMSFSGLKTALRQAAKAIEPVSDQDVSDLCAAFQAAAAESLAERVGHALARFTARYPTIGEPLLVIAGGVAANNTIRAALENSASAHGFRLLTPPPRLCTDNAVMIAWAGAERMMAGLTDHEDAMSMAPRPRWPLDETVEARIGSGRRGAKA